MRSVPMVSRRCRSERAAKAATCSRLRPYTFRVGRARRASTKPVLRSEKARQRRATRARVAAPTSAPKTGISGRVTRTMTAARGSRGNIQASTKMGTATASASCGR